MAQAYEARVSGRAYFAALDPMPEGCEWPEPDRRPYGRGHQYTYLLTQAQRDQMASHLMDTAMSLVAEGDATSKLEARACAHAVVAVLMAPEVAR